MILKVDSSIGNYGRILTQQVKFIFVLLSCVCDENKLMNLFKWRGNRVLFF